MSEGAPGLRLIYGTDHFIQPITDSWYTQNGGLPADPLDPYDYPIEAVCMTCSSPILAKNLMADWVHFERVVQSLHGRANVSEHHKRCRLKMSRTQP